MPQQTNKPGDTYSDESLDPAQQEWDTLVNRPDMQALDDRGDAKARDNNWDDSNDDSSRTPTKHQARREEAAENRRAAERKEWEAAENRFGYRKPGDQEPTTPRRRLSGLVNKKNALFGGIAGGSIGIALAFFGFLSPLKIPGIMQMISDEAGQRVEHIVTYRAKVIVARVMMEKLGVPGGPVITGKGPLSSLIATLRTNKFEEALKAKGLEFVKEGNAVSLKQNGKYIGRNLKNESKIVEIIESQTLSRDALRAIVKENIPVWQFFKRAKFAKWLRFKYNIPRYGVTKTNAADADENARIRAGEDIDTAARRQSQAVDDILNILKGSDELGEGKNGQATRERTSSSLKERLATNSDAVKGVLDGRSGAEIDAIMRKVTDTITKQSLQKVGSKVIPVYGWVTGIATLVVTADWLAVNGSDGTAARTLYAVAASSQAAMFGDMSGIDSQLRLGELPQHDIEYYSEKLTGVENSQAFSCIQKQWSSGCEKEGIVSTSGISERNPKWLRDYMAFFKQYTGQDLKDVARLNHDFNPVILLSRAIFWIDDAIWGVAGNAIMWFIENSPLALAYNGVVPQDVRDTIEGKFTAFANSVFGYMLQMFGLNVNLLARGGELFNIMFSGADFAYNQNCVEMLGCHEISNTQANSMRQQYLADKRDEIRSKGALYAVFSPDIPSSLTTRLAISLPASSSSPDVVGTMTKLARFTTSSLSSLASIFSPSVMADGQIPTEAVSGSIPRGLTEQELNMQVSYDALATGQCPAAVEGKYDPCIGDSHIIQTMICAMDQEKIETPECNPDAESGADSLQASGTCPEGTNLVPKITKGWDRSGKEKTITLCSIPGTSAQTIPDWKDERYEGTSAAGINEIVVNSEAAESLRDAAKSAKASGVTLSISVGYRSLNEQCSIYIRNHSRPSVCPSWITPVNGNWSTDVTYSNHMMGYSIDTTAATENWMRRCVKDTTDSKADNRCYNFYDDVYQNQNWDSAHFTYKP